MSTNQPYAARSMNGIITIDDGAGGTMEDGVVTCNDLETPRISVDQIQSKTVGANVSLYTTLTGGSIHIGNPATTITVDAPITIGTENVSLLNASKINSNSIQPKFGSPPHYPEVNLFTEGSGSFTYTAINVGRTDTLLNYYSEFQVDCDAFFNYGVTATSFVSSTEIRTEGLVSLGPHVTIFSDIDCNTIHLGRSGIPLYVDADLYVDTIKSNTYGTNKNLLLEEFGSGRSIQMGNVSNPLIIYAPTTIVDTLKAQTIISSAPTSLSQLFTNNTSGNVSIATGLTTGILTLGGAGVVNIKGSAVNISTLNTSTFNVSTINTNTITATNTSSNAVIYNNITTGSVQLATNTSSVVIGTNSSSVAIGFNANKVEVCNLRMSGSEIRTIDSASSLTIGGANMSTTQIIAIGTSQENVYFGSTTATANMFVGDFRFTNDTLNLMIGSAPNVSGTMQIGNALTVGSLQLGTGLTTGNVSIGSNTMTGNINLLTSGSLLLGNSASSIELGTTASITNNINLGNVSTTFNINSSTINLSSKFLNIGAVSVTTNIGTQASTANNITLGNVSTNLNFNASTISIGTTVNSNAITIGNISTVQLGIKSPINPDYDTKYAVTPTSGGTPTGCIGNYIYATTPAGALALTSPAVRLCATFTNLPIGVWLLYWTLDVNCPTTASAITNIGMTMATSALGTDILTNNCEAANFTLAVGRTRSYTQTQIYTNLVATTDIYFSMAATFTGTLTQEATSFMNCKALRLA